MGLDTAPKGSGDLELAEVHVGPAVSARGRLHLGADLLFGAASEARDIDDLLAGDEFGELV